jgi:hypothetical protein
MIFLLPAAAGKPVPDAYWACRVGSLLAHLKTSSLFISLVANADLFFEKSTVGWLLVAALFLEKITASWW